MGLEFLRSTPFRDYIEENPEKMRECCLQLIPKGGILVAEREGKLTGMIGFFVFPHFLSGETMCAEMFWWVEWKHRAGTGIRLMRAAEKAGKEAGATKMLMVAPIDEVAQMYVRMGYQFSEASYWRNL